MNKIMCITKCCYQFSNIIYTVHLLVVYMYIYTCVTLADFKDDFSYVLALSHPGVSLTRFLKRINSVNWYLHLTIS